MSSLRSSSSLKGDLFGGGPVSGSGVGKLQDGRGEMEGGRRALKQRAGGAPSFPDEGFEGSNIIVISHCALQRTLLVIIVAMIC
jgi:hypothetical protein